MSGLIIKFWRRIGLFLLICLTASGTSPAQQVINPEDIQIEVPPTIRTIVFTGNTVLSSEELREATGLRSGQLLTEQALRDAVTNIQNAYAERGYLVAITDIQVPQPGQVGTLSFQLQEVRISEIRITGLQKTREETIRRLLTTEEGELFSRLTVQQDVDRLQELGIFETIEPSLEFATPSEAALVLNFQEREKLNYIQLGGTLGQPEGLVGRVALTLSNIRGRADTLRAEAFAGGREGTLGGRLRYDNPWVGPRKTSLSAQVYSTFLYRFSGQILSAPDEDIGSYFERRTGASILLSRPQRQDLNLAAGLRYESIDTNNLPPQFITNAEDGFDSTVFLGSFQGALDRRNALDYPSDGSITTGRIEVGTADIESRGSGGIAKLSADRRWYIPLRKPVRRPDGVGLTPVPVLAFRALAGASLGDLPFPEQFFIGGISGIPLRGYREDRFWGPNVVLGSIEYRQPISRTLVAAAFVDTGDAWNSDYQIIETPGVTTNFEQHTSFSPRFGGGVGIRYSSPFGPLVLDFAYGEEFRIHFNFGSVF